MHYMKIQWREFPMVIGRGRRREHPKDTSEGITWPSATMGVAQLPVGHAHTQGNPEGVKWTSVTSGSHVTTMLLRRKKNAGENRGIRRTYFRPHDSRHFRSKGPTRADIAQLPVAHVQNILPDRARDWVTSGHVTSGSTSQHLRKCDFVRTVLPIYNLRAMENTTKDNDYNLL